MLNGNSVSSGPTVFFKGFVHSTQRNLHYSIFPLQKTICILIPSLAKAVRSYSVLLGRMKTNAASLDETKFTRHHDRRDLERVSSNQHLDRLRRQSWGSDSFLLCCIVKSLGSYQEHPHRPL